MFARSALIVGGIAAVVGFTMFDQASDLKKNYTRVDATITNASVECYVETRKRRLKEKSTGNMAYMDCDIAPAAAKHFGFSESDIKRRVTVTYEYESPVDGNYYNGEFTRKSDIESYVDGARIKVFAHKEKPGKAKTPSGNLFLGDSNV
ncbi:MAG: hypothetical protein AAF441_25465 [Pseudomonadota bacterium]